jgi:hypothetical protein
VHKARGLKQYIKQSAHIYIKCFTAIGYVARIMLSYRQRTSKSAQHILTGLQPIGEGDLNNIFVLRTEMYRTDNSLPIEKKHASWTNWLAVEI